MTTDNQPQAHEPQATKRETQPARSGQSLASQISGVQIMFAAIVAIGLILAINFSTRISSSRMLDSLYANVENEIDQLKREQGRLYEERDYAMSDAYVERWAREDGKMVKPGEVLVIPLSSNILAGPTPAPPIFIEEDTSPPEPETWSLWWSLFFDGPPPSS